jgi:two-component system sensor histidine kinase BaeS
MRSLALKLTLAFLFVGVIGAILVAVFVGVQTRQQFDQFLSESYETALVDRLAIYYEQNGSWQGANRVLMQVYRDEDKPRFEQRPLPWMIVNENGTLVMSNPGQPERQIPERDLRDGTPIEVNGETVGYLVRIPFEPFRAKNPSPEEIFLARVTTGIWLSFGVAAIVALLVGFLLAKTITNPIKDLTEATTAVAGGELGRQVAVRSKDEIGELASSFNQMSTDLSRASQQRRQMTADIAHELRTPLSIILGYTESLRDGVLPPDGETFDILHDEAEHLSRVVQDLRTLSLADADKLALQWQILPPNELLQTVQAKYRYQAEQQGITLSVQSNEDLPEIEVDPGRMEQVLGNLVSNALRFTPEQGEIRLTAVQPDPNHINLIVQDNGEGIPADVLPKIFDRFYKADKSRQAHEGESGLGLAIARSIVHMHNGTINVKSRVNEGTTFIITLPIQKLKTGD